MFLRDYTVRVVLSDCNPSSQKVNALVDLSDDISEILPFLNTVLKGLSIQSRREKFNRKKRRSLHYILAAANFNYQTGGRKRGQGSDEELKEILKETYERRDQIKPTYTSRPIPRPLDIFKLLPGKNCKECRRTYLYGLRFETGK